MTRPTSGADKKLIEAGRRLLQEKGITGLNVREACRIAKVNTGIFHYYFGSKEAYLTALLKGMYSEFLLKVRTGAVTGKTPRERLKNALIEEGKFAREIQIAMPLLLSSMVHDKKKMFHFITENFTKHIKLISVLAEECRPASAVKGRSVPFIMAALLPIMIFPVLLSEIIKQNGVKKIGSYDVSHMNEEVLSDLAIAERAEIALRGIGL